MTTTRRFPRVELALDVRVRFENIEEAVGARTLNISKEGLFIEMERPSAVGTRVRVRLDIADSGEVFAVEGVVVRAHPDPEELAPGGGSGGGGDRPAGVAVFLTLTPTGWARWCEELVARRGGQ